MSHNTIAALSVVGFIVVFLAIVVALSRIQQKDREAAAMPAKRAETVAEFEAAWSHIATYKRRVRRVTVVAFAAWLLAFGSGMLHLGGAWMVPGVLAFMAAVMWMVWGARTCKCPVCGADFFPRSSNQVNPYVAQCARCGTKLGAIPPTARSPLTDFAGTRGMRVLHPRALETEVRGVRVAIEQPREQAGTTVIDADASNAGEADLTQLRARVAANLPGARVVTFDGVARIEIPSAATLDPNAVDEAIDALGEACSLPERGPFR